MTKKELKKEAEEKAVIYFDSLKVDYGNVSVTPFSGYDVFVAYEKGALDFAEPREKRIEELEQQIEKMKCCENCKNQLSLAYGELSCDLYGECKHYSKWELKEIEK